MANGIKEYDDQDTKYNPAEALSAGEQAALDQMKKDQIAPLLPDFRCHEQSIQDLP